MNVPRRVKVPRRDSLSSERRSAQLLALNGPLEGQSVPVSGEPMTLGRHQDNGLVIREIAVSRHHAVIERQGDGFVLRDLDSRHGTSVNGQPIDHHRLAHGDRIVLCGMLFLFLAHDIERSAGPVHFEGSTLARSTVALEAGEGLYFRPEGLLTSRRLEKVGNAALRLLLQAGARLGTFQKLGELAEHLLGLVLEAVPAERAALLLAGDREGTFESTFVRTATGGDEPIPVSRTVTLRVLHERSALLSNDVHRAEGLEDAASLQVERVGSLLCVPLLVSEPGSSETSSVGVLYLDDRRDADGFREDHLQLLTAVAGMAATAISNLRHLAWIDGERRRLQAQTLDHDMVGASEVMQRAIELIARVARTDTTVLVRGESGTGKELAARAIHRSSSRCERPFVAINCATLSDSLLESELFGHEKGAFTGAAARKIGKLEVAHTGTVFLDEVGELPLPTQAKLLRVLQERELERVGGTRPIRVDLRVIAATNRDLERAIRDGDFREDLFYRLNVIAITLPALRDRRGDVPLLAGHFAELHAARLKRSVPTFSPTARRALEGYDWPGNVRELSNAIERALVLCSDDIVRPEDLPEALLELPNDGETAAAGYHDVLLETKKELIVSAVREARGNITEAARRLELHPNYLHRLIKNLDLRSRLL